MNIFNLIEPILKREGFTDGEIQEFRKNLSSPTKFEDLPQQLQEIENLKNIRNKWIKKAYQLVDFVKNEEIDKVKFEEMPKSAVDIDGYYYYLIHLLKDLYPFRMKFKIIGILHKILHILMEKQELLKECLILTEIKRLESYNYDKNIVNIREKAENEINKIKWEKFLNRYKTIDILYEKALNEKEN